MASVNGIANGTALVIVDMVNPLDFPKAGSLLRQALPAARKVARLRARLKPRGVPTIFINDNFTHWREDSSDGTASMTATRHRNALSVLREMEVRVMPCASIRA